MSVFTNPASRSAEQAAAYTTAILGLLGTQDPMEVLEHTPRALELALGGIQPQHLAKPEAPGKWSVQAVLRHLADSEIVWAYRMRLVLAQDRPPLTGYDQDLWAERLGYSGADVHHSLAKFTVLRGGNLRVLRRATPADLKRVGVHAERGEESVERMLKLYAGHDILHLNQIVRIRKAVSGR